MKIDTDLRAAIRSAEKCQPVQNDYEARRKQEDATIADFFKRNPSKAKKCRKLAEDAIKAEALESSLRKKLCDHYGLRFGDQRFQFSNYGGANNAAFIKAGGRLPESTKHIRWTFDKVITELASAEPKQLKGILAKYGIKWE